jgi:hypothetical protein
VVAGDTGGLTTAIRRPDTGFLNGAVHVGHASGPTPRLPIGSPTTAIFPEARGLVVAATV